MNKEGIRLGITEFMLRYMSRLCLRESNLKGTQMCIVTGPRIGLAITLIDRINKLFADNCQITFDGKETVIKLNDVHIEAYPSHQLNQMASSHKAAANEFSATQDSIEYEFVAHFAPNEQFGNPGITIGEQTGNIFVADYFNNRVGRKCHNTMGKSRFW